jgi:AAA family ATP:ADP antiporter
MGAIASLSSNWLKKIFTVREIESGKFFSLFILKFFVCFNYAILTATKDTVVITAAGGGAEVIPVLKGGVVLIIAFAVMLLYSKMCNKISVKGMFYVVLAAFAAFFLLYGLVLFPHASSLRPNKSADWLLSIIGNNHKHWVAVYRDWVNSLFFVLAELWGAMMIGILFWGFANQVNNIKNAMKFYVLYTAGGQMGTMFAGLVVYYYSNLYKTNFIVSVSTLMAIVIVVCGLIATVYCWANQYVLSKNFSNTGNNTAVKSVHVKTKLSLRDSLVFIMKSPYLGLIAFMVIGYGISINMVEVSWKAMVRLQFPNPTDCQAFMGIVQTILGAVSLFVAAFIGRGIIRNYGWYISAQLTPIILAITSGLFFAVYFIFPDYAANNMQLMQINFCLSKFFNISQWFEQFRCLEYINFAITPLGLLVVFGAIHNISCKTMKYCLFDTTKEMAYIPLDKESKIKGKAAVDLVGSRFGKSGASWTQLALIDFIGAGSILDVLYLLCPCIIFILIFWIFAVKGLNKRFIKLQQSSKILV